MKIRTQAEADRSTLAAIARAEKEITRLVRERSRYSGQELKDIDATIAQYRSTIAHFRRAMG